MTCHSQDPTPTLQRYCADAVFSNTFWNGETDESDSSNKTLESSALYLVLAELSAADYEYPLYALNKDYAVLKSQEK